MCAAVDKFSWLVAIGAAGSIVVYSASIVDHFLDAFKAENCIATSVALEWALFIGNNLIADTTREVLDDLFTKRIVDY